MYVLNIMENFELVKKHCYLSMVSHFGKMAWATNKVVFIEIRQANAYIYLLKQNLFLLILRL